MKRFLGGRFPLLLILLGGTALRLFRLGADSLWYDETVSTFLAGSPLPELIRHTAGDIHPPLYYALLRGWLLLMGYGTGRADPAGIGLEFSAAFFSLFFGVALIALAYARGAPCRRSTRCAGCRGGGRRQPVQRVVQPGSADVHPWRGVGRPGRVCAAPRGAGER